VNAAAARMPVIIGATPEGRNELAGLHARVTRSGNAPRRQNQLGGFPDHCFSGGLDGLSQIDLGQGDWRRMVYD
jgi:hypothetical protein